MAQTTHPGVNKAVEEKALRHIEHHGGLYGAWYVGIEEKGSDRDDSQDLHLIRYDMASGDEARLTMSRLLEMGLIADDEYGSEQTVLFIYTRKK